MSISHVNSFVGVLSFFVFLAKNEVIAALQYTVAFGQTFGQL